ncbi:MAG: hypothetical protein JSS68_15915 [Actinobacteria bacterium]|nr:hypothetical protein [Actinomycetota bacterium]
MLRGTLIALMTMLVATVLAVGASTARATGPSGVPFGFAVPATNGWTAEAFGSMNPKTEKGVIGFDFTRRGASVLYVTARVSFTETTVTADFGALGEIEVHSVPTGGTTTEESTCGGAPVAFPSGRWEGTIRFHGEEGFTAVDAVGGDARIGFLLDILCAEEVDEGIGGRSPGALLSVQRHHGTERLELTARKNKREGPSRVSVDLSEKRGGIFIDRSVKAEGGSSTFDFEIPPGRAKITPPKPFSGSLDFTRTVGSKPSVTGNLMVNFPGRANVPVLGPGKLRASLVRAVLNPSHPF